MERTPKQQQLLKRYGPWALVTGASDGIGREIAVELAAAGLNVVLVARRRERLEQLAVELSSKYQIQARAIPADLAKLEAVDEVVRTTNDLEVGLLVAAAGFGTSGNFVDSDLKTELEMLEVNCAAVLALCHPMARRFVAQKRGGIILFSSLVGFQGVPRQANYAATKAFVQSFAEGLGRELAPLGVEVLASAPGPVQTGFAERANLRMSGAATAREVAKATLAALGRSGTVRPGFLATALEAALVLLPRWARTRILAQVMRGMTAHQS